MNFALQDSLKLLPDYLVSTHSVLTSEDLFILVQKLGISIFIGILIGLEREHSRIKDGKIFAGIRTYPLIAIFGFSAAFLTSLTSVWVYISFFAGFAVLVVSSYIAATKDGRLGGTSEITSFLVFILGSLVFWNFIILAAIIAVIITLFLSLKIQLHSFVGKISAEDLFATLKLAVITIIILPLLPDKTLGPLDIINLRLIWYMVILVSGISFIGYILIKTTGKQKGTSITGLMGGLVSSTAVTYSLSRKSKIDSALSDNFAIGVILASTVMYIRVFIVISVLNFSLLSLVGLPLVLFTIIGVIVSFILNKRVQNNEQSEIDLKNPFELKSAIIFGGLFGVIIFAAKAAQVYLGTEGVYAASTLAGITSVDAIVLSLAKLAKDSLSDHIAVQGILLALISNNIFKAIISYSLGDTIFRKKALLGLILITVVPVGFLIFTLI